METRRTFLTSLVLVGAYSGLRCDSTRGQSPVIKPPPPIPSAGQPSDADAPTLPNPDKKILENNDKDMKKKVEHLYQLASELKEEVEKTDSSKVLSLDLMKKAEEIEKLAHDIKNRSKG
ncbi:MAG: hypothetical protein WBQ89_05240 [Candidatus Acidiferrum sp.]